MLRSYSTMLCWIDGVNDNWMDRMCGFVWRQGSFVIHEMYIVFHQVDLLYLLASFIADHTEVFPSSPPPTHPFFIPHFPSSSPSPLCFLSLSRFLLLLRYLPSVLKPKAPICAWDISHQKFLINISLAHLATLVVRLLCVWAFVISVPSIFSKSSLLL